MEDWRDNLSIVGITVMAITSLLLIIAMAVVFFKTI